MLCGPREPFDYAIYGIVFWTLGNWSLEHRTGGKVPRIEANCCVIATHHTIPAYVSNFPEFNLSARMERECAETNRSDGR